MNAHEIRSAQKLLQATREALGAHMASQTNSTIVAAWGFEHGHLNREEFDRIRRYLNPPDHKAG